MLAELVGSEELRELIDPAALDALEAELQALDERRWARHVDGAHDLLRRLGDLTAAELRARCSEDFSQELVRERRAVTVRIASAERLIAAEDASRYRDGLGVQPPAGVPEAFLVPVPDARLQLVRRWARTHGPFVSEEPAARFGLPVAAVEEVLADLVAAGSVERGAFRPGGSSHEWCDSEVLRTLRQRSLAALRREVEPVPVETVGRFLPAWHGVVRGPSGHPASLDRLYEVVAQLQGFPIPASVLERDVLRARLPDYAPRLLDELLATGEVMWVGAGPLGHDDGRVVLLLREQAGELLSSMAASGDAPSGPEHERLRDVLGQRGACFFRELSGAEDRETLDALWDLVWAGEVTNDGFAPVRASLKGGGSRSSAGGGSRRRPRLGSLTVLGPPRAQGRWSLVRRDQLSSGTAERAAVALAGSLLERHGVLTREAVRAEGVPGGFAGVYPVLRSMEEGGRIRRGYFVAGLGGAQFALPGAVDRLRAARDEPAAPLVLAATDPANPYGLALAWPKVDGRPQRAPGAYVVLVDGLASIYLERGGRSLLALRPFDGTWEDDAIEALGGLLADGRFSRLSVERYPPELEASLRAAGFVPSPRGLIRYA